MSSSRWRYAILALLALPLLASGLQADEASKKAVKEKVVFGALQTASRDAAKADALAWLKTTGKMDDKTMTQFTAIWAADEPVLDQVTSTIALGNADAAKLLADARDPNTSAPTAVPNLIKDAKQPAFLRANLALAYAKALSSRRVYEEGLEALKTVKVEQVVDPSSYLFHKAVAEHELMMRQDADDTILRLLDDVLDAPERHKMVAALMHFDMQSWKEKDLGWIARKMNNIERRLDLTRGGPKTQKMQKEVVMRLDEIIKQLEKQGQGQGSGANGGQCPDGGSPDGNPSNNIKSSNPMKDSKPGTGTGPGNIDPKKLKEMAEVWGKLPERERAKAMVELTKDLPPRYRDVIETYFKKLAQGSDSKK
jgi:hypothetical protein